MICKKQSKCIFIPLTSSVILLNGYAKGFNYLVKPIFTVDFSKPSLSGIIEVFLNALLFWQTSVYDRRLPNRFMGEFPGYLRCLYVVYWFVEDFFHKIKKYALTDSFTNHLTCPYTIGKLANVMI